MSLEPSLIHPHPPSRLRPGSVLAYLFSALPLALLGVSAYVFLPKLYASKFGADLVFLGWAVLAIRLWSAFTDPVIGALSDGTGTRLGRRLSWIAAAAVPLAVTGFLFFSPRMGSDLAGPHAWFLVTGILFFTFLNAFAIPYEALGAELAADTHERTSLVAARTGFLLLGTLLAAAIPYALDAGGIDETLIWPLAGAAYGAILLVGSAACIAALRGEPNAVRAASESEPRLSSYLALAGNRPFMGLLAAFLFSSFANAMPAALILFYVEDVLVSTQAYAFLALYFLVGILALPVWVHLAKRLGKRRAWITSMAVNTGAFLMIYPLGAGDELAFAVLVALSAFGLGGTLTIPPSIQADVIEYEEKRSGRRREGRMMAVWSVARESSTALGTGLALLGIGVAGYQAAAPPQSESAISALRVLYTLVPSAISIAAIACVAIFSVEPAAEGGA